MKWMARRPADVETITQAVSKRAAYLQYSICKLFVKWVKSDMTAKCSQISLMKLSKGFDWSCNKQNVCSKAASITAQWWLYLLLHVRVTMTLPLQIANTLSRDVWVTGGGAAALYRQRLTHTHTSWGHVNEQAQTNVSRHTSHKTQSGTEGDKRHKPEEAVIASDTYGKSQLRE